MHFPHCRAYLKFYFIFTLNAQKYVHLLSCFLLFFELNVNLNLKFKSQFRKVSVVSRLSNEELTIFLREVSLVSQKGVKLKSLSDALHFRNLPEMLSGLLRVGTPGNCLARRPWRGARPTCDYTRTINTFVLKRCCRK